MITRFSDKDEVQPSFIRKDVFTRVPELIWGYWVICGNDEVKITDGDLVITTIGLPNEVVTKSQYEFDKAVKTRIDRLFGQQITEEIISQHNPDAISDDTDFIDQIMSIERALRFGKTALAKDLLEKSTISEKTLPQEKKEEIILKIDSFNQTLK